MWKLSWVVSCCVLLLLGSLALDGAAATIVIAFEGRTGFSDPPLGDALAVNSLVQGSVTLRTDGLVDTNPLGQVGMYSGPDPAVVAVSLTIQDLQTLTTYSFSLVPGGTNPLNVGNDIADPPSGGTIDQFYFSFLLGGDSVAGLAPAQAQLSLRRDYLVAGTAQALDSDALPTADQLNAFRLEVPGSIDLSGGTVYFGPGFDHPVRVGFTSYQAVPEPAAAVLALLALAAGLLRGATTRAGSAKSRTLTSQPLQSNRMPTV
jgi:hypothetical protein